MKYLIDLLLIGLRKINLYKVIWILRVKLDIKRQVVKILEEKIE